MRCRFCDRDAVFSMEGHWPDVAEIGVCRDHVADGERLLAPCQYQQVCYLEVVRQEDLEREMGSG